MAASKSDERTAKLVSRSITSIQTQALFKMPGSKALGALRWFTHGSNGVISNGFEQSGVCAADFHSLCTHPSPSHANAESRDVFRTH
jgi:hypothetical protein